MPFDGSGNFTRAMNWVSDATAGIKILAARHDTEDNNLASGLSNAICKDGQTSITADIPFNGKRITGLASPINPQDAATKAYADIPKASTTGLAISGADENGRLTFTSPTGANGLAWTGADLSWIARLATAAGPGTPPVPPATINRLVLNDKADGTGTDVVEVREDGSIKAGAITSGAITSGAITSGGVTATGDITATGNIFAGGNLQLQNDATFIVGNFGALRAFNTGPGSCLLYDTVGGNWTLNTSSATLWTAYNTSGNFGISGPTASKPGGGLWSAPSDGRIKTVHGSYDTGLAAVLALDPVRYEYKTNLKDEADGEPVFKRVEGREFIGLVAQNIEVSMPELITLGRGILDGVEVNDIRSIDPSPLVYALVNAVKELSARIEVLEARP